jgi:Rrf2 family protein
MHLSQTAEYALRAMARLAMLAPGGALRSHDLSRETDIPSHYLSKVLRKLVVAGLLKSRKGHGGGFMLAKAPQRIRFLDVLEAVEYRPDPNRCAFGWGACSLRHPCPLHTSWSELDGAVRQWATRTTLHSVLERPEIFAARRARRRVAG